MEKRNASAPGAGSTIELIGAWLLVGIPLAWGVYNTALNAAKLFTP